MNGDHDPSLAPGASDPIDAPPPPPPPPPPQPFAVRAPDVTHVIIEIFGGDNDLSLHVREDLWEAQDGMDGPFAVLALADFLGEEARVVEVNRDGLFPLESWGEIDTGDPEVLTRFLARALATYGPQVLVSIGFWDHGTGVFDEHDPAADRDAPAPSTTPPATTPPATTPPATTPAPSPERSAGRPAGGRRLFLRPDLSAGERAMLHDASSGGLLTNREAGRVLAAAFEQAKRQEKAAVIFSDTCLNGMVEVLCEMEAYARVIVASEDLEPSFGWDYTQWLQRMSAAPPQDAEAWGRMAVESFAASYGDRPELHPCTLGAFRTESGLTEAFAALVAAARERGARGWRILRDARGAAQRFAGRDSYDLGHFARLLVEADEEDAVTAAARTLHDAVLAARVEAVAFGEAVGDAEGLAFWFPHTRMDFLTVEATYRDLAFDRRTGWSAYLRSRYVSP